MKNRVLKTLGISAVCAMSALTLFGCGQAQTETPDDEVEIEDVAAPEDDGYDAYISDDGMSATLLDNDGSEDGSNPSSSANQQKDLNVLDVSEFDPDGSIEDSVLSVTPSESTEETGTSSDNSTIDLSSTNPE